MGSISKCPFLAMQQPLNQTPQKLDLKILNPANHSAQTSLNHTREQYLKDFATLDLQAVKKDLVKVLRTSVDWWPSDYGHYGPFMVRLAWHQAGTYRAADGRGGACNGNMRFNPLDSWPDNGNLDKARRLLWPIKQKYGKKLSWSDLIMLVGNVAQEDMGFQTFGFAAGRVDSWAREEEIYFGKPESFQGLANEPSKLEQPLGAIVQSLIYVNPEGPDGIPDPLLAAGHIRETFSRMSMNDYETVALIAGGHTFGKAHGAAPGSNHGPNPSEAGIEEQGFGWTSKYESGKGGDTITSGLEGAWTANPAKWDHGYFQNLFNYEWELYKSPGGANQWRPKNWEDPEVQKVPLAHDSSKFTHPFMLTTDLSLRMDPEYYKISKNFLDNPEEFRLAYAKAWHKLTHRDMGPQRRGKGSEVPEEQLWQDPISKGPGAPSAAVQEKLKQLALSSGLSTSQLVRTAWACATTYRHTDCRGGCNGARIRLAPQKDWPVNNPEELKMIMGKYEELLRSSGEQCSMADFIVLAGNAGVEEASRKGGCEVKVPFTGGRGDASQEQTDINSFKWLEPTNDGFRNYNATAYQLVDRAHLMKLTVPEMSVLLAGMRVMGCNVPNSPSENLGVFTSNKGALTNDFFTNLLSMDYKWEKVSGDFSGSANCVYQSKKRGDGSEGPWMASSVDLTFGSNPELRAVAEHYACDDSKEMFNVDFAKFWANVMEKDMYDGSFA